MTQIEKGGSFLNNLVVNLVITTKELRPLLLTRLEKICIGLVS